MFRWVEHMTELEIEIEAASETEVFREALAALAELLAGREPPPAQPVPAARPAGERRRVRASAPDRPALLASWLEELVFLAEQEGFEALALESLELAEGTVDSIVSGRIGSPPPLIKAVTYHRLEFTPVDGGYRARAVLDV